MQSNPKNITRFTSDISKHTSKFTSETNQIRLGGPRVRGIHSGEARTQPEEPWALGQPPKGGYVQIREAAARATTTETNENIARIAGNIARIC